MRTLGIPRRSKAVMVPNIIWLIGGIAFNVLAAASLKYSTQTEGMLKFSIGYLTLNKFILIALLSYLIAFGCYAQALEKINLSIAQPIYTIGSLTGVLLFAILFFDENIGSTEKFAYILMFLGLCILISSAIHRSLQ